MRHSCVVVGVPPGTGGRYQQYHAAAGELVTDVTGAVPAEPGPEFRRCPEYR